ncbi:Golgi-associated RAB2 interactor protein 5B [Rhynchocyon petersi]
MNRFRNIRRLEASSNSPKWVPALGKLQKTLQKGEYLPLRPVPMFESNFIQVTHRGGPVFLHHGANRLTMGMAATLPGLMLPDLLLIAKPLESKDSSSLILTRMIPLDLAHLYVHDLAARRLKLRLATGCYYYLELDAPEYEVGFLFDCWIHLINLLRDPFTCSPRTLRMLPVDLSVSFTLASTWRLKNPSRAKRSVSMAKMTFPYKLLVTQRQQRAKARKRKFKSQAIGDSVPLVWSKVKGSSSKQKLAVKRSELEPSSASAQKKVPPPEKSSITIRTIFSIISNAVHHPDASKDYPLESGRIILCGRTMETPCHSVSHRSPQFSSHVSWDSLEHRHLWHQTTRDLTDTDSTTSLSSSSLPSTAHPTTFYHPTPYPSKHNVKTGLQASQKALSVPVTSWMVPHTLDQHQKAPAAPAVSKKVTVVSAASQKAPVVPALSKKTPGVPAPAKKAPDVPAVSKKTVTIPAPSKKFPDVPIPSKKALGVSALLKKVPGTPVTLKRTITVPVPSKKMSDTPIPLKKAIAVSAPSKKAPDGPSPQKKVLDGPSSSKKVPDVPAAPHKPTALPIPTQKTPVLSVPSMKISPDAVPCRKTKVVPPQPQKVPPVPLPPDKSPVVPSSSVKAPATLGSVLEATSSPGPKKKSLFLPIPAQEAQTLLPQHCRAFPSPNSMEKIPVDFSMLAVSSPRVDMLERRQPEMRPELVVKVGAQEKNVVERKTRVQSLELPLSKTKKTSDEILVSKTKEMTFEGLKGVGKAEDRITNKEEKTTVDLLGLKSKEMETQKKWVKAKELSLQGPKLEPGRPISVEGLTLAKLVIMASSQKEQPRPATMMTLPSWLSMNPKESLSGVNSKQSQLSWLERPPVESSSWVPESVQKWVKVEEMTGDPKSHAKVSFRSSPVYPNPSMENGPQPPIPLLATRWEDRPESSVPPFSSETEAPTKTTQPPVKLSEEPMQVPNQQPLAMTELSSGILLPVVLETESVRNGDRPAEVMEEKSDMLPPLSRYFGKRET